MRRPRSSLWDHQVHGVQTAVERKKVVELLDVGYGKTVITETALLDLDAFPALVVAPAAVVETNGWGAEAGRWDHLAGTVVTPLVGSPAVRSKLLRSDSQILTLSYNNLSWLADEIDGKLSKYFKAIVFDEVSYMKSAGARRFRRMRSRVDTPVSIGLTATPVGNHLLDLWGEMFIVAGEAPLGPTFSGYRDSYFEPVDYWRRVWRLKCCPACRGPRGTCTHGRPWLDCECHRRALADIRRRIRPYVFTSPAPPASVGIPPVRVNPIRVAMPKAVLKLEDDLTRDLWATLPSGAELEALAASAVAQKRRQMAGGVVYKGSQDPEAPSAPAEWEVVHTAKLEALDALLDAMQGAPALVYYWYRHEATAIKARMGTRQWMDMATHPKEALDAWNAGQLEVLLAHPMTGGVGLNLQDGGHHVIWYTLPWADWVLKQGHGRLARPGQSAPWVESHLLLCGPMDDRVYEVLQGKGDTHNEIMKPLTTEDLL